MRVDRSSAPVEYRKTNMTAKARITRTVTDLLAREPQGIHHMVLVQLVSAALPDVPVNTIRGCVVGLAEQKPDEIYKPAKGLFQHTKYREEAVPPAMPVPAEPSAVKEEDFYAGFAEYLTQDLEECTKCIPLRLSRSDLAYKLTKFRIRSQS
jgi:hypothetical protein